MLPKDFPPVSTVQALFLPVARQQALADDLAVPSGHAARVNGRGPRGPADPGVIDSQTVKTTRQAGFAAYDAGKKINGRKRHTVVDTTANALRTGGARSRRSSDRDRRSGSAEIDTPYMPLAASPVCRRRIRRTETARRPGQGRQVDARDRQALRHRQGLRSPASTMGRRTHLCMARAMSAAPKDWEKSIASSEAWINIAHIRLTKRRRSQGLASIERVSSRGSESR